MVNMKLYMKINNKTRNIDIIFNYIWSYDPNELLTYKEVFTDLSNVYHFNDFQLSFIYSNFIIECIKERNEVIRKKNLYKY